jgi:SAM-dependent methyltransferase
MTAWRRVYERYLVAEDIYPELARRIAAHGARSFIEAGGGRGPMARLLQPEGVLTAVGDVDDQMMAETCPPAIKADLGYMPIRDRSVDAVAAINCLSFLADPTTGVREAASVLRSGGLFLASVPSRWNDPELEGIDPRWGQPSPFDSEDAPTIVGSVFGDVEVDTWEAVAYRLPDHQAVGDYLQGSTSRSGRRRSMLCPSRSRSLSAASTYGPRPADFRQSDAGFDPSGAREHPGRDVPEQLSPNLAYPRRCECPIPPGRPRVMARVERPGWSLAKGAESVPVSVAPSPQARGVLARQLRPGRFELTCTETEVVRSAAPAVGTSGSFLKA